MAGANDQFFESARVRNGAKDRLLLRRWPCPETILSEPQEESAHLFLPPFLASLLASLFPPFILDGLVRRRFFHGTNSLKKLVNKLRLIASIPILGFRCKPPLCDLGAPDKMGY
jgi:hypothetical protein